MNTIQQYHHTIPKLIKKINHDKYIYALCHCPMDSRYGLVIDRNELTEYEKETGWCCIHCNNCGLDIEVRFNKKII